MTPAIAMLEKKMKKPTIAQMKRRPTLWAFEYDYRFGICIQIQYPDNSCEYKFMSSHRSDEWNPNMMTHEHVLHLPGLFLGYL